MIEHFMILPLSNMYHIKSNILDQTGLRIARCDFDGQMCDEADANATYIIKCVNGYGALRTALNESTDMLRRLRRHYGRDFTDLDDCDSRSVIVANEAALMKGGA